MGRAGPRLVRRYRCLRYDTRGHGRSEVARFPSTISPTISPGLLDALGIERAHVVGLSLGGMTAQTFAVAIRSGSTARSDGDLAHMPPTEAWPNASSPCAADGMGALVDAVIGRWFTPARAERDPEMVRPARARFSPSTRATPPAAAIRDMDLRPAIGGNRRADPDHRRRGDDPATPVAMLEDIRARSRRRARGRPGRPRISVAIEQANREFLPRAFLAPAAGRPSARRVSRQGSQTARACSAWTMRDLAREGPAPLRTAGRTSSRGAPGRDLGRSDVAVEDAFDGDARA